MEASADLSPQLGTGIEGLIRDVKDRTLPPFDELIVGFVRAIGTDVNPLIETVSSILDDAQYAIVDVHVSDLLEKLPGYALQKRDGDSAIEAYQYYKQRMDAANKARKEYEHGDLLARLAVEEIAHRRREDWIAKGASRIAYLVRSLMHPGEIALLRHVYGSHFISIAVFQSERQRWEQLKGRMIRSRQSEGRSAEELANELVSRDRGSHASSTELSVEKTFHLCDVFVDVADPTSPRTRQDSASNGLTVRTVDRLFDQIFSRRNGAPSRHESAMANAYIAALRSKSLSRRVGAALTTPDGDLISVGWNEVPAIGGGQYPVFDASSETLIDRSDPYFTPPEALAGEGVRSGYGYDANDLIKYNLVKDLLVRLHGSLDLPAASQSEAEADGRDGSMSIDKQMEVLLADDAIRKAKIFEVIEYGRAVHAEMSALISASGKGLSAKGMYLYCTTFPCHECARHLIAAGISRVVYVEPYPKSRVFDLHSDATSLGQESFEPGKLNSLRKTEFLPFIGISPSRQSDLFSWIPRKHDLGAEIPPGRSQDPIQAESFSDAPLRWSQVEHRGLATQLAQISRQAAERLVVADLATERGERAGAISDGAP